MEGSKENYLKEYAEHFPTVEVDQWFWSLFAGDKAVLPKAEVVREYAASVPEGFLFSIKVPNSITLTHHYRKGKSDPLIANPHFLSVDLMLRFLESIEPLGKKIGPLNFQFEYLNKQKISGLGEFLDRFGRFIGDLPAGLTYCLETRNPNFFHDRYFDFLAEKGLYHVFLHGYYMPSIFEVYRQFGHQVKARRSSACTARTARRSRHRSARTGAESSAPGMGNCNNWQECSTISAHGRSKPFFSSTIISRAARDEIIFCCFLSRRCVRFDHRQELSSSVPLSAACFCFKIENIQKLP
jgi:uncharacterized protein YecE (DUF72 family)